MASNRVSGDSVSANATTASVGAQGDDASNLVTKDNTASDSLASQASHDREQGQPGVGKSAFSHAKDFEDGAVTNDGPVGDVERLTADTAATNRGDGNFMASLDQARQTQEENHSTTI